MSGEATGAEDGRVRIKICGVTTPGDARLAVRLGADFLGLNFYEPSPRCISEQQATEIRRAVGDEVRLVGVFVNASAERIERADAAARLDLLQFHGDEDRAAVAPHLARAIRALRPGETREAASGDPDPEVADPEDLARAWVDAWALLFDTPHATLYGGSGQSWSYERIAPLLDPGWGRRVFLAGGLGPDNVAEAVRRLPGLWGVDVCSGVEAAPGRKDPQLLERLITEIRHGEVSRAS